VKTADPSCSLGEGWSSDDVKTATRRSRQRWSAMRSVRRSWKTPWPGRFVGGALYASGDALRSAELEGALAWSICGQRPGLDNLWAAPCLGLLAWWSAPWPARVLVSALACSPATSLIPAPCSCGRCAGCVGDRRGGTFFHAKRRLTVSDSKSYIIKSI
jgi:hypothetical protein